MRSFCTFVAIVACTISCGFSILAAIEESDAAGEDSSAGLSDAYAKNYLIAVTTISPDKKFAVIYPTLEAEEAAEKANHPEHIKDYVVALRPFAVLGELQTYRLHSFLAHLREKFRARKLSWRNCLRPKSRV
jgi:hypothetical protein